MLVAIGIYNPDTYEKLQFAQQEKSQFGIFPPANQLENLEKNLIKISKEMENNTMYTFIDPNERNYHYIVKFKLANIVIGIVSKKVLDIKEQYFLIKNASYIFQKKLSRPLEDMIVNPYGYIGRELFLEKLKEDLADLKDLLLDISDKLILRGFYLKDIEEKSEKLSIEAHSFKKAAQRLNRCC